MRISELEGVALDYWVSRAEGVKTVICGGVCRDASRYDRYQPSLNWALGGPIIDRNKIGIEVHDRRHGAEWGAWITTCCYESNSPDAMGPTALVAAMRAYLVTVYGTHVPDEPLPPDEEVPIVVA